MTLITAAKETKKEEVFLCSMTEKKNMKELHWLNFIVYNMFTPMNSKKNWANGGTTEQTRNQKPET